MSAVRRWGGYVALVVVFAVACGLLSWWQWSRRAEAVAAIERVAANYDAVPVPVGALLPTLDAWELAHEWRPVVLHGRYLVEDTLLVRNRPHSGASGFEVLVPFRLDDGRVFAVDRGWLPVGSAIEAPDHVPAPPAGEVTVVARLRASEPELPGRSAPEGQLATVHLPSVAEFVEGDTYTGAYGLLVSEDPAPAEERPVATARPDDDEGPHLSYALQWIAFGVLAFAGLIWAVRRERRLAVLPEHERAAARRPRQRSEDADFEDRVLDGR